MKISKAPQRPRKRYYAYSRPEFLLIQALQNTGLKFTTQEGFYCSELNPPYFAVDILIEGKLICEVDGPKHDKPRVKRRDEARDEALRRKG